MLSDAALARLLSDRHSMAGTGARSEGWLAPPSAGAGIRLAQRCYGSRVAIASGYQTHTHTHMHTSANIRIYIY